MAETDGGGAPQRDGGAIALFLPLPSAREELGRLAGLSHDLGKYSMEFQRRLANGPREGYTPPPASFACWRMGRPLAAFAAADTTAASRTEALRGFPGCRNLWDG